jgi:hypothetical protein
MRIGAGADNDNGGFLTATEREPAGSTEFRRGAGADAVRGKPTLGTECTELALRAACATASMGKTESARETAIVNDNVFMNPL